MHLASVTSRYPHSTSGQRPGPIDLDDAAIGAYEYTRSPLARRLTTVQALKALDSLEYQSCDHPSWPTSAAAQYLERLRRALICALPGYDEADWEIRA